MQNYITLIYMEPTRKQLLAENIKYYFSKREQIEGLYDAFYDSQRLQAEGKARCYTFRDAQYGSKLYCGRDLIAFAEGNGPDNDPIDAVVRGLFEIRSQITTLLNAPSKARSLRSMGRSFMFFYKDPHNPELSATFTGLEIIALDSCTN